MIPVAMPAIPTDNLYKLIAIGGFSGCFASVAVVFYGTTLMLNEHTQLRSQYYERRSELHARIVEQSDIEISIAAHSDEWNEGMKSAYQKKLVATKELVEMMEKEVAARDQGLLSNGKSIGRNIEWMTTVALYFSAGMFALAFSGSACGGDSFNRFKIRFSIANSRSYDETWRSTLTKSEEARTNLRRPTRLDRSRGVLLEPYSKMR